MMKSLSIKRVEKYVLQSIEEIQKAKQRGSQRFDVHTVSGHEKKEGTRLSSRFGQAFASNLLGLLPLGLFLHSYCALHSHAVSLET